MKINQTIIDALIKAINDLGSQQKIAEVAGVGISNIGKYINGNIKTIRLSTWERLFPLLKTYLTQEQQIELQRKYFASGLTADAIKGIIAIRDAAQDEPMLKLLIEYWQELDDTRQFQLLSRAAELSKEKRGNAEE
ncbi:MAG: hypothetical protein VB042_05305 [Victivallaceae bacterium]|nr:hypothetical protein [Victivallaceae bacterium]